ncbi:MULTISPECIES: hypothetical protein [unclassified Streptomyces]|uniref:hypothetical protein n=1 Tax=unclassified Streptomyces TaxID=2593676 RepID=UPI002E811711|nr:hypothetical protein [Streptomyces sp. NBC_00589]WTI34595.1 hypothetical protein OIC96_06115 [Streptomyces sp. NBC_00775]WUB31733.1 hypothetical protein OHA51_43615 [Streptomyces sp. NBC_00589]
MTWRVSAGLVVGGADSVDTAACGPLRSVGTRILASPSPGVRRGRYQRDRGRRQADLHRCGALRTGVGRPAAVGDNSLRGLFLAAGPARLKGWAYFDARRYNTACPYFYQSPHLAKSNGDRQFIANVLARTSLSATCEGESDEAVTPACAAQGSARDTTPSAPAVTQPVFLGEGGDQRIQCAQIADVDADVIEPRTPGVRRGMPPVSPPSHCRRRRP